MIEKIECNINKKNETLDTEYIFVKNLISKFYYS